MSPDTYQRDAFYRQVAESRRLWTFRRENKFPLFGQGRVALFWSTLSRVQRVKKGNPQFDVYEPHEITWDTFLRDWAPRFIADGTGMGLNWGGSPIGVSPWEDTQSVVEGVQAAISAAESGES